MTVTCNNEPQDEHKIMWRTIEIVLHRNSDEVDAVLLDTITPLVESAVATGAVEQWYWLRYWHGGPHLRVRVKASQSTAELLRNHLRRRLPKGKTLDINPTEFYQNFDSVPDTMTWRNDGDIDIMGYEPEIKRYGGIPAIYLAEDFFSVSSSIAATVMANTRNDADRRFRVAFDLLALSIAAAGWDSEKATRELRGYFAGWDFSQESVPISSELSRSAAQQAWSTNETIWSERVTSALSAASNPQNGKNAYTIWFEAMQHYRADLLQYVTESIVNRILWSQIHMLHNRLGLNIEQERLLCWLMSLVTVKRVATEDTTKAIQFLEASKYGDTTERGPARRPATRPEYGQAPRSKEISPKNAINDIALRAVLQRRRSATGPLHGPIPQETLATLLQEAVGVRDDKHRSYPSPGALYPTECRVILTDKASDNLELYRYDTNNELAEEPIGLTTHELNGLSPYFSDENGEMAPVILLLVCRLDVLRTKYNSRSLRLALLESGHVAQNLALVGEALGLSTREISGYNDDALNAALHLNGIDAFVSDIVVVGLSSR